MAPHYYTGVLARRWLDDDALTTEAVAFGGGQWVAGDVVSVEPEPEPELACT